MKSSRPELVNRTHWAQRILLIFSIVPVVAFLSQPVFAAQSLISQGAVWRYLDDGSNQGTGWRELAFNDSTWPQGPAQLGFGDGDEATILRINPDVSQRAITFYFRRPFTVSQPASISNLTVRLLRDDGGVVYLNGVEVFRSNMPEGPISYNTLATSNVGGADETTNFYSAPTNPALLLDGVNVVAVEIHQVGQTSGDVSFDLSLTAETGPTNASTLPVITVTAPDNSASEIDPNSDRPTDPGLFRVVRSGPTNDALHITYALSGTASNGVDYATLPGFVELPAGAESVNIQVDVIDDSEVEGTETIRLSLLSLACASNSSPGAGCYRVGSPSEATVSVLDSEPPANRPPTVALTSPADGADFVGPTNITLIANGNDPDGYTTLQTVEFFEGTHSLGIRTNYPVLNPIGPFVLQWENVMPGQYTLTAVATDDHGATATSALVHITVREKSTERVTLISTGAVWKYLDNGTDQGSAWRGSDFDDSAWAAGPAQLGYGDGDEQTVVSYGPDVMNKYITTYFRRGFEVSNAAGVSNLTLRVLRDDGVVVYLNGQEIYRNNMPAGSIAFNTLASSVAPDENEYLLAGIPRTALLTGRNVIAAEVHQVNGTSSDVGFDLELVGNGGGPPPEVPVVNVVATAPNAGEGSFNSEGVAGAFTFYRSGNLDTALTAYFALNGSASNGIDYARLTNRVTFAQGSMQARVLVMPMSDNLTEGTETVVLTLESPACAAIVPPPPGCYSVGPSNQATVFIADSQPPTNRPPNVTFVTPHEGDTFSVGANIQLGANATDDGQVVGLEFFANGNKIGDARGPLATPMGSWLLTWSNVTAGEYSLTAQATDAAGLTGTAGPLHIRVLSGNETNITLVSPGSVWKYSDQGANLGIAWRELSYSDTSWSAGPGQLGYGDGDEATVVSYGPDPSNKYVTTYFRKKFVVGNAANIASLQARLLQDDGSVVYLNGSEVFRSNMPGGLIAYNTFATVAAENQTVEFPISAASLHNGTNILAVEVHQSSVASSDLSFDLRLTANIGPRPDPTNQPPFVQLNAPHDGDMFSSPTNIELVAYAQDPEDSYEVTVEFFAGEHSLGIGTFVPTRCAVPYCPNFALTWSNVPPGSYRLTARAIDKSGASSFSAPVNITVQGSGPVGDRELHVVGIYSGTVSDGGVSHTNEQGEASVVVNRPGKAVTLFLSSYEPVLWHLNAVEGTTIQKVILSGYYRQQVTGLPPGVEVVTMSYEQGTGYIFVGYSLDSARFYQALPRICAMTGLEILSFHGSYQAPYPDPFVIDSVQEDERLKCNYPQPTPLSELPSLSFRVAFYDGGIPGNGRVFFQNYTLGGAQNGGRLLPAPRVVADGGGQLYYGAERQDVFKIDSQTGTSELMQFPAGLGDEGWPMGVAYDPQRERILLVTLGGEGFLYGYAPASGQWSRVSSMNNRDVDCLVYHPSGDRLYAVTVNYGDYGNPAIDEFGADGTFQREIRLPVLPFSIGPIGYHSELVSVGDYLVLLLEPDSHFPSSSEPQESRMYLIDPRTEQVWLTYRRVGPPGSTPQDTDGDGVPDNFDRCPGTAAGAVVNSQGCSIAQLCPCTETTGTNTDYVRCVIDQSWRYYREGLITELDRRAIIGQAAQSPCAGIEDACLNLQPQRSDEIQQDGLCFVVSGGVSGTCVLECSTDMVHWITVQTVTMPTTSMEMADPTTNQASARFYRLRYQR